MQIINAYLLLIQLFLFIKITTKNHVNSTRFLSESNPLNKPKTYKPCNLIKDCFNCTLNPSCRWFSENISCQTFKVSNSNHSLPILSHYNNIVEINNHINFIRKSCFGPINPFIKNENYFNYDNSSLKYCGDHYIIGNEDYIKKKFKLEIKNINGIYGTPNLLCEFIFLSTPGFHANIKINDEEINNFYLLYSEDSINFVKNINSSTTIDIDFIPNKLNTFIFYGLKSFENSPFTITYKEDFSEKAKKATGYIMIVLSAIMIIIIIIGIICIRKNSIVFKKKDNVILYDENEQLKKKLYGKEKSEEIKLKEKIIIQNPKFIYNFTPPTNTPTHLLNGQAFIYDKCCVDEKIIDNLDEIKMANCGHFYHISCFNKLIQEMNELNEKELKCISCKKVIYPEK